MFARKLLVEVIEGGKQRLCPLDWLDNFCMRNFTGDAQFDDTLPVGEGTIEAGFRVSDVQLAEAMAAELREKPRATSRGSASPAGERARLNVTRALQTAIRTIARDCPVLGRHLETSVRTGSLCAYVPDPGFPVVWEF